MSTPQPVSTAAPEAAGDSISPTQYHLHGDGVWISYYPDGAGPVTDDGPVIVAYRDLHQSLTFRGKQATVDTIGLGTCVTVTLQFTDLRRSGASYSTTATILIPHVVLAAGQPATVQTELITAVHDNPGPLRFFGGPQLDSYTVTRLTGQASNAPLPL